MIRETESELLCAFRMNIEKFYVLAYYVSGLIILNRDEMNASVNEFKLIRQ